MIEPTCAIGTMDVSGATGDAAPVDGAFAQILAGLTEPLGDEFAFGCVLGRDTAGRAGSEQESADPEEPVETATGEASALALAAVLPRVVVPFAPAVQTPSCPTEPAEEPQVAPVDSAAVPSIDPPSAVADPAPAADRIEAVPSRDGIETGEGERTAPAGPDEPRARDLGDTAQPAPAPEPAAEAEVAAVVTRPVAVPAPPRGSEPSTAPDAVAVAAPRADASPAGAAPEPEVAPSPSATAPQRPGPEVAPLAASPVPAPAAADAAVAPTSIGRLVAATVPDLRAEHEVRLSVRLDPPSLGHVTVDISTTHDGAVHVVVRPSEPAATAALDAQRSAVSAALADAGFALGGFDVRADDRRDGWRPSTRSGTTEIEATDTAEPSPEDGALRL